MKISILEINKIFPPKIFRGSEMKYRRDIKRIVYKIFSENFLRKNLFPKKKFAGKDKEIVIKREIEI